LRRKIFEGTMVLGMSQVLSRGLSFLRNVIIARLISPADFGIAATFVVTVTLFELVSNFGLQLFIIQDPDGENEEIQNSCHFVQLVRGVFIAFIIFLLAWPISNIFHIPQSKWAFQLLAIIPLIHGLNHLDMFRFQRNVRFMPKAIVETVSEFIVLLAAWPLGTYFGDYSALLWLLIAKSIIFMITSHIVANRHYAVSVDLKNIKKIIAFGWPLTINGLLLFGTQQGDRLIIGSNYDMTSLGLFSVALTLTSTSAMMIANINRSLMLPLFSAVQNDKAQFLERYKYSIQFIGFISFIILLLFILYGDWLIDLIYGAKYSEAAVFILWLAAMETIRIMRSAPTQASIAVKDTKNSMYANISRTIALPTALIIALFRYDLIWIPFIGFIGEFLAYMTSILRLKYKQDIAISHSIKPLIKLGPIAACAVMITSFGIVDLNFLTITFIAIGLLLLMLLVGFLTFDDSRTMRERYTYVYSKLSMYLRMMNRFRFNSATGKHIQKS